MDGRAESAAKDKGSTYIGSSRWRCGGMAFLNETQQLAFEYSYNDQAGRQDSMIHDGKDSLIIGVLQALMTVLGGTRS